MRGRKPCPLVIARDDRSILLPVARQTSLPAYQVQRARIVLGVAAGEPIVELAEKNYWLLSRIRGRAFVNFGSVKAFEQ